MDTEKDTDMETKPMSEELPPACLHLMMTTRLSWSEMPHDDLVISYDVIKKIF